MMRHLVASACLFLVVAAVGIIPLQTFARTMVSQEEYYDWLQSDNRNVRKRMGQLDEDPVKNIPVPILFGVSPSDISPNFGDPRSGGRAHEGEDIMAPKGAPIISPTEAVVLETGTWPGAGKYVSTANPGGEKFVYMHLDWIADLDPGDVLSPGGLIGYVGNTGNASGGAAHLHLEIRKSGPIDPFPRLNSEFSLTQKMGFLDDILGNARDEGGLVAFLVAHHRNEFLAAQAMGLELPGKIAKEMTTAAPGKNTAGTVTAPPADLTLGSRGSEVIALQKFLITQNKGPAARGLSNAGATGNFGPATRNALIEYQKAGGITPANGYYGPLTRSLARQANSIAAVPARQAGAAVIPATVKTAAAVPIPGRDLELGAKGTDVAWLQTFLILKHSGPASETLAKTGSTGYFGPATKAALAEYQNKAGVSPAAGYFGPTTRSYVAAILKAG